MIGPYPCELSYNSKRGAATSLQFLGTANKAIQKRKINTSVPLNYNNTIFTIRYNNHTRQTNSNSFIKDSRSARVNNLLFFLNLNLQFCTKNTFFFYIFTTFY